MRNTLTQNNHICFISAGLAGGGMERSLTNIANYAASNGHKVTILNLFTTEIFFDLHPDIVVIWPTLDRNKMHRLVYAIRLLPFIRKIIKGIKPTTILSFGEWFNGYVLLATRFLNIPVFITDRMGPLLNLGFLLETARKIMYKYATGIIAQTSIAANILYQNTKNKNIRVIPNALIAIDSNVSVKKNQIVTVGRLTREKGHDVLINAFALLPKNDWTLHIVGDGNRRKFLNDLVAHHNIKGKVIFYGHLKEFSAILGKSDIFVLPSFYEGFPNALIEAMSVPLACISSNCVAGPSDIIEHGENGLLFETGNIGELAKCLERLINDHDERQRLATKAIKIREQLDFNTIASQYIKFILSEFSDKDKIKA